MKKLQTLAVAAVVAATLGAGSLAASPAPALAAKISCADAIRMARNFKAIGDYYLAIDEPGLASYYYGRSDATLDAAC
jgi:hypothetical protein